MKSQEVYREIGKRCIINRGIQLKTKLKFYKAVEGDWEEEYCRRQSPGESALMDSACDSLTSFLTGNSRDRLSFSQNSGCA